MDIWVGDSAGSAGADIARRVPVPAGSRGSRGQAIGCCTGRLSAESPQSFVLRPGESTPEELVSDAQSPAATTDGGGIVFVSTSPESPLTLWAADAAGRRTTQLGPASLDPIAVTPDDRFRALLLGLRRDVVDPDGADWRGRTHEARRGRPGGGLPAWRGNRCSSAALLGKARIGRLSSSAASPGARRSEQSAPWNSKHLSAGPRTAAG